MIAIRAYDVLTAHPPLVGQSSSGATGVLAQRAYGPGRSSSGRWRSPLGFSVPARPRSSSACSTSWRSSEWWRSRGGAAARRSRWRHGPCDPRHASLALGGHLERDLELLGAASAVHRTRVPRVVGRLWGVSAAAGHGSCGELRRPVSPHLRVPDGRNSPCGWGRPRSVSPCGSPRNDGRALRRGRRGRRGGPGLLERAARRASDASPWNFVLLERAARTDQRTLGPAQGARAAARAVGVVPWWLARPADTSRTDLRHRSRPGRGHGRERLADRRWLSAVAALGARRAGSTSALLRRSASF